MWIKSVEIISISALWYNLSCNIKIWISLLIFINNKLHWLNISIFDHTAVANLFIKAQSEASVKLHLNVDISPQPMLQNTLQITRNTWQSCFILVDFFKKKNQINSSPLCKEITEAICLLQSKPSTFFMSRCISSETKLSLHLSLHLNIYWFQFKQNFIDCQHKI